jgi:hypothetical protein
MGTRWKDWCSVALMMGLEFHGVASTSALFFEGRGFFVLFPRSWCGFFVAGVHCGGLSFGLCGRGWGGDGWMYWDLLKMDV